MGFMMLHLAVAAKIMDICSEIFDCAAFNIGSLSPDAVGFIPTKQHLSKSVTHLCVDGAVWGQRM